MQNLAPTENEVWKIPTKQSPPQLTDEEVNVKYAKRELRIVTESNREQLPNFVEALKRPGWMALRPFYQRRPRWDKVRQSKLIESFIMNVPVPPLFVYESDLAKYEVMDGQQRITAVLDFYTKRKRFGVLAVAVDLRSEKVAGVGHPLSPPTPACGIAPLMHHGAGPGTPA